MHCQFCSSAHKDKALPGIFKCKNKNIFGLSSYRNKSKDASRARDQIMKSTGSGAVYSHTVSNDIGDSPFFIVGPMFGCIHFKWRE